MSVASSTAAQSPVETAKAALQDATAALREGNYQKALPLTERAAELAEQSGDRGVVAAALAELGRARWGRGQYDAAHESYERGLTIFRELSDANGEAEIRLRMGETRFSQSRYPEALEQYNLALAANARMGEPSRVREGSVLGNIGVALRFLGRYDESAASIERALAIARERRDEGLTGQVLVFLGITNRARAEYQQAIDAYTEAIAIRTKLGDRRGVAQALGNLGNVYHELGNFEKAIDSHTRSLTIAKEVGYTAQVGFSTNNLAAVLASLGREALPRYEEALAVWRQIDRQAEVSRTLREIGVHRFFGRADAAGARAALDEALAIARKLGDRESEARSLLELGSIDLATGDHRSALARFENTLEIARAIGSAYTEFDVLSERGRARLALDDRDGAIADLRAAAVIVNDFRARVTSDESKVALVDRRMGVFRDLAAALFDAGRVIEALEAAEGGRARAFGDVLHSRLVRPKPADRMMLDELRTAKDPAALDRLRRQNEELASLVTADTAGIAEIRATAARLDATIIEYLVGPDALLIWVVSPNGEVNATRANVTSARLSELTRHLLASLDVGNAAALASNTTPASLRELYQLVVTPVAKWLPRAPGHSMVIVPSGPLSQVPFAALEDATGAPLVSRYTLSVSPAVSIFRYTAAKRRAALTGQGAFVFAAAETPSDVSLPVLPGSLDEGTRVSGRLSTFKPVLLTGANATEQSAKSRISAAAYLHFATHGLVSEIRPSDSSLVLAPGSGDDGYLRAAEIYGLELSADLVVLSGCSTARGRMTGDGVFGLPRAFIYAGTPTVIASLWDISDRATVFLMDRFYAELLRTGNKAASLRTAQLATRERYPSPALWAPFVLIGEPR